MQISFTEKKNVRKSFGKLKESLSIPNLIEVQKNSYNELTEFNPNTEITKGFDRVFKSIFPIEDLNDKATLEYVSYRLEKPKFDVEECIARGLTYSSALKCTLRLVVYEIDQENNSKDILSAKEQEVYMGEVPMMTNSGTFITNGVQRVVVNQMHRSPGVFFDHDKGKTHASGKLLFNCRVIPNRGSWLDFEYDVKDFLYFKIDRKKKILASTLLLALGYSKNEIVNEFYDKEQFVYDLKSEKWGQRYTGKAIIGELAGVRLNSVPSRLESFKQFLDRNPDGKVLIPNELNTRNYGSTPYIRMDTSPGIGLEVFELPVDVHSYDRVVAVGRNAWTLKMLQKRRVISAEDLVIRWHPGQNSIHDTKRISFGRDVGNVTVQRYNSALKTWNDTVYQIPFAFAFKAFNPDGALYYDIPSRNRE